MSSAATSDLQNASSPGPRSKKQKKKKANSKVKPNGDTVKLNGIKVDNEPEIEDGEDEENGQEPIAAIATPIPQPPPTKESSSESSRTLNGNVSPRSNPTLSESPGAANIEDRGLGKNDVEMVRSEELQSVGPQAREFSLPVLSADTEARFDALANERMALRDEVAQLRQSLEQIQEKHDEDLSKVRGQLEETQDEKEQAETQYRNLLGRVNTIRSQLGERLKADAEDLSQARNRIEELEDHCGTLREQTEARTAELTSMAEDNEQRSKELSGLRNRNTLSQQNWSKEREDLIRQEAFAREEFETAKQAMQDWEILAMEERSQRETLAERAADLEDQVLSLREALEKAAAERDTQSLAVDGLQRALQEIQDARKRELRELAENSQAHVDSLQKRLKEDQDRANDAEGSLKLTRNELERALPFEREVKEKNLLIGKLRHEAVILNDHLTKALRYLKKGKPEDNIDKQLVTNHFLHFLPLERGDPKKFQVLQIIAALLGWTDEQREQAGLARPGASNPNLKIPISPWHRTPSTPALSTDFFPEGGTRKESLAELWSDFLEQEAQEGTKSPKSPSVSSSVKRS